MTVMANSRCTNSGFTSIGLATPVDVASISVAGRHLLRHRRRRRHALALRRWNQQPTVPIRGRPDGYLLRQADRINASHSGCRTDFQSVRDGLESPSYGQIIFVRLPYWTAPRGSLINRAVVGYYEHTKGRYARSRRMPRTTLVTELHQTRTLHGKDAGTTQIDESNP